ncbi:hypothetical protein [Bdellovibrio bacteriovorus]|uniref:hypothetical protein n=1 Tax=Bdellovibrio TaxID=958 RepID=UPI0035A95DEB
MKKWLGISIQIWIAATISIHGNIAKADLSEMNETLPADIETMRLLPQNQRVFEAIEKRLKEAAVVKATLAEIKINKDQSLNVSHIDQRTQRLNLRLRVLNSEIENLIHKLKLNK